MDKREEIRATAVELYAEIQGNPRFGAEIIEEAISQARSQAYEECAKIAERHAGVDRADNTRFVAGNIASAIRARSKPTQC